MTTTNEALSRELTRALQEKVEAQEGLRKKLVGVVLQQQWAEACTLFDSRGNSVLTDDKGVRWPGSVPPYLMDDFGGDWLTDSAKDLATKGSPVDVVARYLGEKP